MSDTHMLNYRTKIVIAILGVGALAVTLFSDARVRVWLWPPTPTAVLPAAADVIEMKAKYFGIEGLEVSSRPEFAVPLDQVGKILSLLQPAAYAPRPMNEPHDLFGELLIVDRSRNEIRLRYWWTGHNPVCFTLNGKDYFWGSVPPSGPDFYDGTLTLYHALNDARNSVKK